MKQISRKNFETYMLFQLVFLYEDVLCAIQQYLYSVQHDN